MRAAIENATFLLQIMNTFNTPGDKKDLVPVRNPMDLASKSTLKPGESLKTVVCSQQTVLGNHTRGPIASSVSHVPSRIINSGIAALPVSISSTNAPNAIKQGGVTIGDQTGGLASVVLMSVPRSGLPSNMSVTSGGTSTSPSVTSASRPASTPAVTATTTYHVPRGAAAVANIAAPRPGATSLGRTTPGTTAITHASNLVTGFRGLVPRASSPASTWLGTVAQSPTSGSSRPRAPTSISYAQTRTPSLVGSQVTSRPSTPQGTRVQVQAEPLRTSSHHTSVQKLTSVQSNATTSSTPQVLVTQPRPQQVAASVTSTSVTPRVMTNSGTVTCATVSSTLSVVSGTAAARPVQTALLSSSARSTTISANVRPGNAVNTMANRTTAVTASSTGTSATLALAVGTQVRPRLPAANTNRITTAGPTPRLLSTPTRPATVTATTTVLPTQARLQGAGVLSLHPVVVSSGAGLPLKSATTRPSLGPKMIPQPMNAPASIQITQVPVGAVQAATKLPPSVSPALPQASTTRTVTYSTNATVVAASGSNMRPVNVSSSTLTSPVTKVTLHTATQSPGGQPTSQQSQQSQQISQPQQTSVCIQHRASPAPSTGNTPLTMEHSGTSVLSTYNIPTYLYETSAGGGGNTYQVTGVVARPYSTTGSTGGSSTAAATTYTVQTSAAAVLRPSGVVATSAPVKFNPVVVVDPSRSGLPVHSSFLQEGGLSTTPENAPPPPPPPSVNKPSASPRPSILRKRDNEGSPMKAQKNLTPVLASMGGGPTSGPVTSTGSAMSVAPPVSPPSPRRPDSRGGGGGGNSSGGSTTISATSSPGLGEASEDTTITVKQEMGDEPAERPPPEMSPRKKPRKQQLTGNELHEPKFSEDEMEFISEERIKKEVKEIPPPEEPLEKPPALPPIRRRGLSLLATYRHNWKSRHNHYIRYSDVRPKDERRPTVAELAAQKQVLQKLEGWKVHHLSTQMEELSELEQQVSEKLSGLLKLMEKRMGKELEKDISRINELIKGNMQRSKVTSDQMQEAKSQVMKIFEHKNHVANIINRSGNKRSLKKREKS